MPTKPQFSSTWTLATGTHGYRDPHKAMALFARLAHRVNDRVPVNPGRALHRVNRIAFQEHPQTEDHLGRVNLGREGLQIVKEIFTAWHLFRGGGWSRRRLQNRLDPVAQRLRKLLDAGRHCADSKAANFCANLIALEPALWQFAVSEGVDPTNNHAERVLRRGVLWRKISFGCHCANGCRFVERMLTTVQTLHLQNRNALHFLIQAVHNHRAKLPIPSLLAADG